MARIAAMVSAAFDFDRGTLVDRRSGIVPSFTRATIATVDDWEGVNRQVLSGEARFGGMRRVYNNIKTTSEDFSSADWLTDTGGTGTCAKTNNYGVAPDGTTTACRVQTVRGTGFGLLSNAGVILTAGAHTSVVSAWLKSNTGASQIITLSGRSNLSASHLVTITTSWQRFSMTVTGSNTGNGIYAGTYTSGDSSADFLIWHPQDEIVTGQSNQNPSEYVSVGVLSSPYHGAMVDGVKYFPTENGNTVASNVVTEAAGAAIPAATIKGFQREEARTNLLLQSENLNGGPWASGGSSTTVNATAAPDGATTADKFVESALNELHEIYQGAVVSANTTHTVSVFFKAAERSNARLQWMVGGASSGVRVDANLAAGTLSGGTAMGTGTYSGSSITAFGNGWYRVTLTGILDAASTTGYIDIQPLVGGTPTYLGDGASGFYMWGAQLEASAEASSYIPTTSAAVARNADVLEVTTLGSWFNGVAGAMVAQIVPGNVTATRGIASFDNNSANEVIALGINASAAATFSIVDGGVSQAALTQGTLVDGTAVKVAGAWAANDCALSAAGAAAATDTSVTLPTPDRLRLGVDQAGNSLNGFIRKFHYYPRRLPNTVLPRLSA